MKEIDLIKVICPNTCAASQEQWHETVKQHDSNPIQPIRAPVSQLLALYNVYHIRALPFTSVTFAG
jgi:hypothetical protein